MDRTGFPTDEDFRKEKNREEQGAKRPDWPAPLAYGDFKKQLIEKPRPIVDNLLDVSSRMIFGGGSKTYKTWAMSDMALSVVVGADWWGFPTFVMPALYVNFELKPFYIQRRMRAIQAAKQIADGPLHIWNLRGYQITLLEFKTELLKLIAELGILLVFIDPFYKLLAGRDERVSAEINEILAAFDEINRTTAASVIFSAHFTKGNQAGKDSLDRIAGGGSINRDPDNLVTMTKHETEHAFSVEFTLRDFAPIAPFLVRWEHPLLVRTELDPAKIKTVKPGPNPYNAGDLFGLIKENDDEFSTKTLRQAAEDELGWSRATFYRKFNELVKSKRVFCSKVSHNWNVKI